MAPITVHNVPHAIAVRTELRPEPARVAMALETSFAPFANERKKSRIAAIIIYISVPYMLLIFVY